MFIFQCQIYVIYIISLFPLLVIFVLILFFCVTILKVIIIKYFSGEIEYSPSNNFLLDCKSDIKVYSKNCSIIIRNLSFWILRNIWRVEEIKEGISCNFLGNGFFRGSLSSF